jgi:putative peptide zinc metalloprotease protein
MLLLYSAAAETSPLRECDGSHAIEALLGDELARRSALTRSQSRFSTARNIRRYRAAAALHLAACSLLVVFLRR